jgi:hypothetical protein
MVEEQEDRFSSNSIVGQEQEHLNLQMVKILSANKAEEYVSLLYAIFILRPKTLVRIGVCLPLCEDCNISTASCTH